MQRVIIAGGTGSLGSAIAEALTADGYEVIILTRRGKAKSKFKQVRWDSGKVRDTWAQLLPGSILINLSGEIVDRPATQHNIELINQSRVRPTRTLVAASREFGEVALWLQMSTLAIYGDAGSTLLTDSPNAPDPAYAQISTLPQMVDVAVEWENALKGANAKRSVLMRTGVVLERGTPAFDRLVTMTRLFLGGRVGSGEQYVSWIHVADFVAAVRHIIANANGQKIEGATHITGPQPVTNLELMKGLRKVLNRPWTPPTPVWLVRLGAWAIFRTDAKLALTGRRAVPQRLIDSGFKFQYASLDEALAQLVRH